MRMDQEIIDQQLRDISKLRQVMGGHLKNETSIETMLIVGEGVNWNATFLGHCIIEELLPPSLSTVAILDIEKRGELTFFERLNFEGLASLDILAVYADATQLPFPCHCFDMTVAPLMIDDCHSHHSLIEELVRCTKPDGAVMVSGHGIDTHRRYGGEKGLLGSTHQFQVFPEHFDQMLKTYSLDCLASWQNNHCWLRKFTVPNN